MGGGYDGGPADGLGGGYDGGPADGSGGGYDGGPADGSGGGYDGGPADGSIAARCPGGHGEKLKFPREASCANDGGVEFCIPDNEPSLLTQISAISSTIRCAPGGGRANCLRMPGLLLCSYPTSFPAECTSPHGAMTEEVWSDMCAIAEFPQVLEIVPTIFE